MVILRAPVTLSRGGWLTDQRHFTVTVSSTFQWSKLTFDDAIDNVVSKPNLKVFLPLVYVCKIRTCNILYKIGVTVIFHQDTGMFMQRFCRYKSDIS